MWSSSPINGPRCFLEQETLPLLLSTGWLHERIRSCFHNRTNIYWGRLWKIDLNVTYAPSLNIVKTKSKHREWCYSSIICLTTLLVRLILFDKTHQVRTNSADTDLYVYVTRNCVMYFKGLPERHYYMNCVKTRVLLLLLLFCCYYYYYFYYYYYYYHFRFYMFYFMQYFYFDH